jgi:hypothetical protein
MLMSRSADPGARNPDRSILLQESNKSKSMTPKLASPMTYGVEN